MLRFSRSSPSLIGGYGVHRWSIHPFAEHQRTNCGPCRFPFGIAIPTLSDWGLIIFMVLAGLASVYYLRRQRRTKRED
ncbi:MAG TPA: hypothetical protein DCP92_16455 [Nitrospiraceae bacterium]|nr:hypothetical protein [Nitrospiraceae bacterium]